MNNILVLSLTCFVVADLLYLELENDKKKIGRLQLDFELIFSYFK